VTNDNHQPLAGLPILDLTQVVSGPVAIPLEEIRDAAGEGER
jgi:hypothetical protein